MRDARSLICELRRRKSRNQKSKMFREKKRGQHLHIKWLWRTSGSNEWRTRYLRTTHEKIQIVLHGVSLPAAIHKNEFSIGNVPVLSALAAAPCFKEETRHLQRVQQDILPLTIKLIQNHLETPVSKKSRRNEKTLIAKPACCGSKLLIAGSARHMKQHLFRRHPVGKLEKTQREYISETMTRTLFPNGHPKCEVPDE